MSRPLPPVVNMALVTVICIVILAIGSVAVLYNYYGDKVEASTASATFDGTGPVEVGVQLYRTAGKIWEGCPRFFSEPFETVVFIFRDGDYLAYSTHDAHHINVPISTIADDIRKCGLDVRACTHCVHNHFSPIGFTRGDEASFEYLKRKGFRGVFGIWYTATGRFLGVEE